MKKKTMSLQIDSFRGDNTILYSSKGNVFDRTVLKTIFSDEEINQLEKHFDKFYKLLLSNCIDEQAKKLLKRFKKELKSKYFLDMYREVGIESIYAQMCREDKSMHNNKELRNSAILDARMKLFFFADVVIAFVMGNDEKLRIKIDDLRKSVKESEIRKEKLKGLKTSDPKEQHLFKKVWELEENQRKNLRKPDFYQNFIEINKKFKLIRFPLIIHEGFTSSLLFGRYKAFREQQSSYLPFKRNKSISNRSN